MGNVARGLLIAGAGVAAAYGGMRAAAKKWGEPADINFDNPYIGQGGAVPGCQGRKAGIYEGRVKPALDRALSFCGLAALSPLFGLISLAVYLDDPGPVIFTQKRVGKNKTYFMCHKFRSMKMSAPHDVPTHQMEEPGRYITRVGRVLRKTSLDELPQLWDIFRSRMSVIGPRPALWNQEDLVAGRDKYDANSIMPGLTGLAQINGRDELAVRDKAKLDGEYARALREGGFSAFRMDAGCFFGTVKSVLRQNGIVEGRAVMEMEPTADTGAGFEDYGCFKEFHIDKSLPKNVLITGAGSYIGESFRAYCKKNYPNIECDTMDMTDGSWHGRRFWDRNGKPYDAVFHVAGIAHADAGKVSRGVQGKYYKVNTELAIACCKKAKTDGVRQFIFMSSMIIYGGLEYIDEKTVPQPSNFYGNSKWLADKGVRALGGDGFKVCVLRPPMVYGRGCKGNYPALAGIARKTPVFPGVNNKRSMLYIENLCEFLALIIFSGEGGVYFPQNRGYGSTAEMVKMIAGFSGKRVSAVNILNPAVRMAGKVHGRIGNLAGKAFGNSYYDIRLSMYNGLDYQKVGFEESIRRTESCNSI